MSILDRNQGRRSADDTDILEATIESFSRVGDHVEYTIKVKKKLLFDAPWQISHRYSDFNTLFQTLQEAVQELKLPPKKVFGNQSGNFLLVRKEGLQTFLNTVLSNPVLSIHWQVRKFLDPIYASLDDSKFSLQQVSMLFRSEPDWNITERIPDAGWRTHKKYFFIKHQMNGKTQLHVLSWIEYGLDSSPTVKQMGSILTLLSNLQSKHVCPVLYTGCSDQGAVVVRPFFKQGLLKDRIYKSAPLSSFLRRYACVGSPLPREDIQLYGKQILLALDYIQKSGIPYGHLHVGNILLENGHCRLLDIENGIMGLSPLLRPFLQSTRTFSSTSSIDVYSFAHVLYEMKYARPLLSSFWENPPAQLDPLDEVINSILGPTAFLSSPPTIADLLLLPVFSVQTDNDSAVTVPLKIKEAYLDILKDVSATITRRLVDEQRAVRKLEKFSAAYEQVMSKEATEQRKRSSKKVSASKNDGRRPSVQSASRSPEMNRADKLPVARVETIASASASPPPLPPPLPIDPPPPLSSPPPQSGRGALLGSIQGFNKSALKRAEKHDRSSPRL